LAGRKVETAEFSRLLQQSTILENLVLTGLRGVGKTVLLETFKPLAVNAGWVWVGTDLSESSSISEGRIATRMLTDLAVVTSALPIGEYELPTVGFQQPEKVVNTLDYRTLTSLYEQIPGLPSDKLKGVLEFVWSVLKQQQSPAGVVFAYDEAQTLADHAGKEEYPLSLLLDVFQSIQKKEIPFMLALTGLPTLFPKLVEARTFAERMFHVLFLDRLNRADSRDAIVKPIAAANCPVTLTDESVDTIVEISGGYPYFVQFVCREVYDVFVQQQSRGQRGSVPVDSILRKLDTDFFAGRWARATDRQRDLLLVIATLPNSNEEFSIQEIVERSKDDSLESKPFSPSHVSQMLASLADAGLVYKNRHGKYAFAVPLFGRFLLRQSTPKQQRFPFTDER
jgi:hypothetical protein